MTYNQLEWNYVLSKHRHAHVLHVWSNFIRALLSEDPMIEMIATNYRSGLYLSLKQLLNCMHVVWYVRSKCIVETICLTILLLKVYTFRVLVKFFWFLPLEIIAMCMFQFCINTLKRNINFGQVFCPQLPLILVVSGWRTTWALWQHFGLCLFCVRTIWIDIASWNRIWAF